MLHEIYDQGVYLGYLSYQGQGEETHLLSCIRSGLQKLDIKISENLEDSNLNILDVSLISFFNENVFDLLPLLKDCHHFKNKSLFINMSDCASSHFIGDNDYWLLSTQTTELINFANGNKIPWAFGFQQKLIDFTDNFDFSQPRKREILRNFKPSLQQSVRESLDLILVPKLERNITIDRTVDYYSSYANNDNFLKKLLTSRFCLAYGGFYTSNVLLNPYFHQFPEYSKITYLQDVVIGRWDSWRLWESWVMGCIPITLDFDKYGFLLPVMPENWQHYIGLDLSKLDEDVERLLSLSEQELDEISYNGREWALQYYSPQAVAERALTIGIDKILDV
ncbi:hypothetical protein IQ227_07985 [Anabaena aphanizomenioides LEGE 00250]|uniref:Glycosyltransferase family 1 protein n=1 Tax=Sphaerospermopsis aphanizomenoides LEGE 00250 TaxID=2777972 RepID=A0ABR9VBV0_9CYAN|nr:hypothetical protein [Sphaerospermopsis aphanizomenoides]MBE9235971.1 hypothetical protein [Sphaerospermopsis aphanizomenoides LEGE 00250]